jgi:hypothetical protein
MSSDLHVTTQEIDALASKLDGADLDERERAILAGIFALAGQAAAEATDDVSGFMPTAVELNFTKLSGLPSYLNGELVPAVRPGSSPGSLVGSFSWGMHGAGGGGGAG